MSVQSSKWSNGVAQARRHLDERHRSRQQHGDGVPGGVVLTTDAVEWGRVVPICLRAGGGLRLLRQKFDGHALGARVPRVSPHGTMESEILRWLINQGVAVVAFAAMFYIYRQDAPTDLTRLEASAKTYMEWGSEGGDAQRGT